jgi:superfamily I DNA/RNA helicase
MEIDSEEAYLTAVRSGRGTLRRKQRKLLWKAVREFHRGLARRNLVTFDGLIHQARLLVEEENFPGFRHVLVDEIQDFNLEGLRLIAALSPIASQASDPLCVVGDGHQRIYNPNPVPLSRAGIEVRGRSHRLKINYRTTEEIRRWAQSILHGVEVDDLDGERVLTQGDHSLYHGVSPEVVRCAEGKERAQAVARWIAGLLSDGEIASHEICFSPPDPTVVKQLESDGIKTLELKPRQMDPGQSEPGVRYGTKQRIKGLEFKAVAILDVRQESDNSERFVNYVAATRARERLLVVSLGTNDRK